MVLKKATSRVVYFLALLPILDAIANQVFAPGRVASIGLFSVLQIYRGLILGLVLSTTLILLVRRPRLSKAILRFVILFFLCLFVFTMKEFNQYGFINIASIVAYMQILYWLTVWILCLITCSVASDALLVLLGVAVGAVISASSVLVFSALGLNIVDVYHGVRATSGGFHSGKGLTGILICGGFLCVYLGRYRYQLSAITCALVCFAATFATYNRSGLISLLVSFSWITYWYLSVGRRFRGNLWARRLVLNLTIFGVLGLLAIGVGDLFLRWEDMSDVETAGSGRLINWLIVMRWWVDANFFDKLLGIGHSGMMTIIYAVKGVAIHTHSDFFDFLATGGVLGIVLLMYLYQIIWGSRKKVDPRLAEYALLSVVSLTFVITSLATGQLTQPAVMTTYVMVVSCLPIAANRKAQPIARLTNNDCPDELGYV